MVISGHSQVLSRITDFVRKLKMERTVGTLCHNEAADVQSAFDINGCRLNKRKFIEKKWLETASMSKESLVNQQKTLKNFFRRKHLLKRCKFGNYYLQM